MKYFLIFFLFISLLACQEEKQEKPQEPKETVVKQPDPVNFYSHEESGFSTVIHGNKTIHTVDTLDNGSIYSEVSFESQSNECTYGAIVIQYKSKLDDYIINSYSDNVAANMSCSNSFKKDSIVNKLPCIVYNFSKCNNANQSAKALFFRNNDNLIILTIDYSTEKGFDPEILESLIIN